MRDITLPKNALPEDLVEVARVATILSLSENVVRRRVRAKSIPFRKLGDTTRPRIRFYESEIRAWMDGSKLTPIENGVTIKPEVK